MISDGVWTRWKLLPTKGISIADARTIRFRGTAEENGENNNTLVIDTINEKFGLTRITVEQLPNWLDAG